MKRYEVAVIGGGFAGVAAALAAAREGARVLLVEKGNCLGGAAVNCLVNPFMSYTTEIDGVHTVLAAGLFETICHRMQKRGAMNKTEFLEEELKKLLNDMTEEAGVTLLYHAYLSRVNKEDGRIVSVCLATVNGEMTVEADQFIDATGDAQLAYLAGCPTTLGRSSDHLCQPMTLCFRLGNVDKKVFFESKAALDEAHRKALAAGELLNPREDILVFETPVSNVLHFNTTRVVKKNPTLPEDVTQAEILARKQVFEIYDFMKRHARGLENSFLMATASEIGVRESRMIVGDVVLTGTDCIECRKFEDAIVACNYDIDIHSPDGTGTSHHYFERGQYYTIPFRCLVPKKADNLLVAGRCISSDHEAQASYRIMPTVCCIGEAAGCAVGIAVKEHTDAKKIKVTRLQSALKFYGAFLGI